MTSRSSLLGRGLTLLSGLVGAGIMLLLVAGPAHSQAPATSAIEIVEVQHDRAADRIAVHLRASGTREEPLRDLTVLVDSVPRSPEGGTEFPAERPATLLAIDVSGSMRGAPILAASGAASAFIGQLTPGDPVGVMTFAQTPVLRAPVSPDHAAASAAVWKLAADGETALYDAVALAIDTMAARPEGLRSVVLLSDGADSGISAQTREAILQRATDAGVTVFTIALGTQADREFLRALAEASGGTHWDVAGDAALAELFQALGGRLGATRVVDVPARGLAPGEHEVTVRGRIGDDLVEATSTFLAEPLAPLSLYVEGGEAGEVLLVSLQDSGLPDGVTRIEAYLDGAGKPLPVTDGSIFVDPWLTSPGEYRLVVDAYAGDAPLAQGDASLVIPSLAPELEVLEGAGEWTANARVQGVTAPLIVVAAGDRELVRESARSVRFTPPAGAEEVTVTVFGPADEVVATRTLMLPAAAGSGPGTGVYLLALPLLAGAGWLGLRRRGRRVAPEPTPLVRRRELDANRGVPGERRFEAFATLEVGRAGEAPRRFPLGMKPVTLGSGATAEIRLSDPAIRPLHARFSATPTGDVRVHALAERGARPYEESASDQWVVVQPGEEIALGAWFVRIAQIREQAEVS